MCFLLKLVYNLIGRREKNISNDPYTIFSKNSILQFTTLSIEEFYGNWSVKKYFPKWNRIQVNSKKACYLGEREEKN